jgi:exopolyphosphatase/guanosine-5'-triphosphate,3'-diphosphate pyrophosphatase
LYAASTAVKRRPLAMQAAQGRLDYGQPVAVIDIGSNSVRLVTYEGLTRSPTPIFNEKVLAGLGREVQSTGLLAADAVEKALSAIKRFRMLCDRMEVGALWVVATAACRDAKNGKAFVTEAERICRTKVEIISGKREAELSALGVVCGFHRPDGLVGDLGGGSLELSEVHGHKVHTGITLPLGGLALQDVTEKSIKKAEKLVRKSLGDAKLLKAGANRTFYAIGGTWRALARLHMWQTGYPLHVMHGYVMSAREAHDFAGLVHRVNAETLSQIEVVADARRPLLAYAAVVLENLIDIARPKDIVISALGVREGLLYGMLSGDDRRKDPLITAAQELNVLRSRMPAHGAELITWTDRFMASTGLDETAEERRLRHAACWPTSAGARIPIIAASSRSTSSPMPPSWGSIIPGASISRSLCSSAMSGWSTRSCRRGFANSPRPACSTAPACSGRRCAWPISFRRPPRASCRRRRWWSSAAASYCASATACATSPASGCSCACASSRA